MKNVTKIIQVTLFSMLLMLGLSEPSFAYLPDSATVLDPMYAEITGDITTLSDKSWPIAFLTTGLGIAFLLFKRFTRRAAS